MLSILKYVGTPISLIAFIGFIITRIYLSNISYKKRILDNINNYEKEGAEILKSYLNKYSIINTDYLNENDRFKAVYQIIKSQVEKLKIVAITSIVIALILAIIIIILAIIIPSNQNTSGIKSKDLPKILLRYSTLDFADDIPYGWLYWKEGNEIKKTIALPYTIQQMHAVAKTDILEKDDLPENFDISNIPKASYSIVIVNNTTSLAVIENIKFKIISFKELPNRYICIWNRKGFVERLNFSISISPKEKEQAFFPIDDNVYEISNNENFPIRLNILTGQPGIYHFNIEANIIHNAVYNKINSDNQFLSIPTENSNLINILTSGGDQIELAKILLELSPNSFNEIKKKFKGRYPKDEEIRDILNEEYLNNNKINSIKYKKYNDLIYQLSKKDLQGVLAIYNVLGTDAAIEAAKELIQFNTNSDKLKAVLISLLLEKGNLKEATKLINDFYNNDPMNPYANHAKYALTFDIKYLENAIAYDPQLIDTYLISLKHYCDNNQLPKNFYSNLKWLSKLDKKKISYFLIDYLFSEQFGLLITKDQIETLYKINPGIENLLQFLPENIFLNEIAKNEYHTIEISEQFCEDLNDLLINIGRYRLAFKYASQGTWNSNEKQSLVLIKTLIACYDFTTIVELIKKSVITYNSAFEFIMSGIALIEKQEWELFAQLIHSNLNKFLKRTYLLFAIYFNYQKQNEEANLNFYKYIHFLYSEYTNEYKNGSILEPFELELVQCGSLILSRFLKTILDNNKIDINELLHYLFPINKINKYVYWPIEYCWDNNVCNYAIAFQSIQLSNYLEIPNAFLIRIPDLAVPILNDEIESIGPFTNLKMDDIKNNVIDWSAFFKKRIYGNKLSDSQMTNSYYLHLAWYNYWNAGDIIYALSLLDEIIKKEPTFYDALLLRAKLYIFNRQRDKAIIDFQNANKIMPLNEINLSIYNRIK